MVAIIRTFSIAAGLVLLWGVVAQAKPKSKQDNRACLAAFKTARQLERAAQLRDARRVLMACAQPSCGEFLQHECTARYAALETDIPTVVPVVSDEGGAPVIDVQVTIDGDLLTRHIDGRAFSIDPGLHEFTFATDQGVFSTQQMVILQGQRNRLIAAVLGSENVERKTIRVATPVLVTRFESRREGAEAAPAEEAPSEEPAPAARSRTSARLLTDTARPSRGPSLAPYLLTGVGLAGLGGYGLLTYWGRKDNTLLGQCSPNCSPSSVSHIRTLYLAADVSLGAGLAALSAATWLWITHKPSSEETATSFPREVSVQPLHAGAIASVRGSF